MLPTAFLGQGSGVILFYIQFLVTLDFTEFVVIFLVELKWPWRLFCTNILVYASITNIISNCPKLLGDTSASTLNYPEVIFAGHAGWILHVAC